MILLIVHVNGFFTNLQVVKEKNSTFDLFLRGI